MSEKGTQIDAILFFKILSIKRQVHVCLIIKMRFI